MAIANIMDYFKASQLVAVGHCWALGQNSIDSCWLEQVVTEILLHEWILLDKVACNKLCKGKTIIRDTLSPITSFFLNHSLCSTARKVSNLKIWKKAALWRLCDWVRGQQIRELHDLADRMQISPVNLITVHPDIYVH